MIGKSITLLYTLHFSLFHTLLKYLYMGKTPISTRLEQDMRDLKL